MSEYLRATSDGVSTSSAHPAVRTAATEWQRYRFAAGLGLAAAEPVVIAAETPAALLRAVYRRLEADGWRWFHPGPGGEVYQPETLGFEPRPQTWEPIAERLVIIRTSALTSPLFRLEALRLIDWLPKAQATGLAVEAPDLCEADLAPLRHELARRGLSIEVGGDLLNLLLESPAHTARHLPESARPSQRRHRGEAATGEALDRLVTAARVEIERVAAPALRLAEPKEPPLDLSVGEGWQPPGERLRAAFVAIQRGLGGRAELVAYEPVLEARRGFAPPSCVRLVLTSHLRNLAEPLDSARALANRRILDQIASGRAAELAVPYADLVELNGLMGPLVGLIQQDHRELAAVGLAAVSAVTQGALSWWACPLNLYAHCRCAAEPTTRREAILADWANGLFPGVSRQMLGYFEDFERAMGHAWLLREALRPGNGPRSDDDLLLADMLLTLTELRRLSRILDAAIEACTDAAVGERLADEKRRFTLNLLLVQVWHLRVQSLLGRPSLALHTAARELLGQIEALLRGLPVGVGAALAYEYREMLDQLARWCGHNQPDHRHAAAR